jgi:hypothetical protein
MNYELAKQLKDAGFPIKQATDADIKASRADIWREPIMGGAWYLVPTLEELIEACGRGGFELAFEYDQWRW